MLVNLLELGVLSLVDNLCGAIKNMNQTMILSEEMERILKNPDIFLVVVLAYFVAHPNLF